MFQKTNQNGYTYVNEYGEKIYDTVKNAVVRFIQINGPQRFTDIQRFIWDMKKGFGNYDERRKYYYENEPIIENGRYTRIFRIVKRNPNRGFFSSAFCANTRSPGDGYFLEPSKQSSGYYLGKVQDGKYDVWGSPNTIAELRSWNNYCDRYNKNFLNFKYS
jgi:hypothetical protein